MFLGSKVSSRCFGMLCAAAVLCCHTVLAGELDKLWIAAEYNFYVCDLLGSGFQPVNTSKCDERTCVASPKNFRPENLTDITPRHEQWRRYWQNLTDMTPHRRIEWSWEMRPYGPNGARFLFIFARSSLSAREGTVYIRLLGKHTDDDLKSFKVTLKSKNELEEIWTSGDPYKNEPRGVRWNGNWIPHEEFNLAFCKYSQINEDFKEGDKIEVNYKKKGKWHPATCKGPDKKNRPGYVAVKFAGYQVLGVERSNVRRPSINNNMEQQAALTTKTCQARYALTKFTQEQKRKAAETKAEQEQKLKKKTKAADSAEDLLHQISGGVRR